jgi:hypothetical protein
VDDPRFATRLLERLLPFAFSPASGPPPTRARPSTPIRFTPTRTETIGPPPRPVRPPAKKPSAATWLARLGTWLLLAIGWLVFVSWGVFVLHRERIDAHAYAAGVLASIVIASAALMALWTRHNIRLARKGKRGQASFHIPMKWEHDTLGRTLQLPAPPVAQTATEVRIAVRDGVKSYVAVREERP